MKRLRTLEKEERGKLAHAHTSARTRTRSGKGSGDVGLESAALGENRRATGRDQRARTRTGQKRRSQRAKRSHLGHQREDDAIANMTQSVLCLVIVVS